LEELGADVITIADKPDGININKNCGATSLELVIAKVKQYRADIGIALDGDGDRLMMIDHTGVVVDGDETIAIIAQHKHQEGTLKNDVVGTLMSNLGLEKAIKKMGLNFHRANVGDRYVMKLLRQHDGVLGGESSGHIIVRDRIPTGDGTVAALQILNAMVTSGRSLYQLKQVMTKYPQILINVRIQNKIDLHENTAIQQAVKTAEEQLSHRGRVLLRASGTEPLIRVMVEGETEVETRQLAMAIAEVVEAAAKGGR
jgi:phosphoglucosamine mutase